MVSANLDIRGNQIDDRRIRATEQNDLGSPLQIIVHDMKGAGTVPAGDGLSLVARTGEAGDLRINNGSFGAIERKASPRSIQSGGMKDRKSTRLNSSHLVISYAVFCLKKKKIIIL